MSKKEFSHIDEPSAGELPEKRFPTFAMHRRKFLQLTGGGLLVAFVLHDIVNGESSLAHDTKIVSDDELSGWLHIGEDGKVTVFTGKVEVGQNIRTSLSQQVAEELKTPLASITMIMGDTILVPYDAGTFGSRTTPQMGPQLRKAAATAREALMKMAADKWKVSVDDVSATNGTVVNNKSKEKISYGELTKGEDLKMAVNGDIKLIDPENWTIAGTDVKKVAEISFLNGGHKYTYDMQLPGMWYGKILRPPSFDAKLMDADISKAQALPDVVVVKDGDFLGVAAKDTDTAAKALDAIDAKWEEKKALTSYKDVFDYFPQNTTNNESRRNRGDMKGDVEHGLAIADARHSAKYHIDYIAHVPLEPRSAVAEWKDGMLNVWTGTQRPFGVQEDLADIFKMNKDKIRVRMPDMGSGYGGKHTGEAAIEAARLAKAANRPVKVNWTREEEFTWAYFRPGGLIDVEAGVKKDGTIAAWKFINYNSGGAGLQTQYIVNNLHTAYEPVNSPLRQGSYRGLAATANVFTRESVMSDLAKLVGMDQLAFRLKNLDDERFIAVLKAAAEKFGWGNQRRDGHGYGIAGAYEKGDHVAACVEVAVNSKREVKIIRVTQAFECGAIVNPHHLENQVTGALIQGLGGALFESIQFANGKILNPRLSQYRVPRFSDVPKIEVILINRKDVPSAGAGEAGIVAVAPAIRNAILDATGIALTTLPMLKNGKLPDTA